MDDNRSFGAWFRQYRRGLDLTQRVLADRVGCSEITIRKIEADQYRPSSELAYRMAECLGVPTSDYARFAEYARSLGGAARMAAVPPTAKPPWQESASASGTVHPTNIQPPFMPTIGRQEAIEQAASCLSRDGARLLTLVGAPGIGKTRLGIEIALRLLGSYEDGVFMVELAVIRDVEQVGVAIAQALGIENVRSREALPELSQALRDKRMLLLLDNFEQVIGAASQLVKLLATCPALKVIVTSREALHLNGERVFEVQPLVLPDVVHLPSVEELQSYSAVALFVERSRAVRSSFTLASENAGMVAAICARLEGIPLAIELAAARSRLLPPKALLARLSSRLNMVAGGDRDSLGRHQTLRQAIAWSYELLDAPDRALFRRLGVFVHACGLSAVEAVCNAHADLDKDVLEGLESLLDKHLLQVKEDESGNEETRLTMLQTIREYALEQLAIDGEEASTRDFHAQFYLAMAEAADLNLTGAEQKVWLDRLERDHDNLRAALQHLLSSGEVATAARMGVALRRFWEVHGHFNEGVSWLRRILTQSDFLPALLRAKVLNGAGTLMLGLGNYEAAVAMLNESVTLQRDLGDDHGLMGALNNLGMVVISMGNHELALPLFEEALATGRRLGDKARVATLIGNLAVVLNQTGDLDRAEQLLEESLSIRRELGHKRGIALALGNLAELSRTRGNYSKPVELLSESLVLFNEVQDKMGVAKTLDGFAAIMLAQGRFDRATLLLSSADALLTGIGASLTLIDSSQFEDFVSASREGLGSPAFDEAWAKGQAITVEQVVSDVLAQA